MPKVMIREKDNTSAEPIEYNDFVALVPGGSPKFNGSSTLNYSEKLYTTKSEFDADMSPNKLSFVTVVPVESKPATPAKYNLYVPTTGSAEIYTGKVWKAITISTKVIDIKDAKEFDVYKTTVDEVVTYEVCESQAVTLPTDMGYKMALKLLSKGLPILYVIADSVSDTTFDDKYSDKGVYDIRFITSGGTTSKAIAEAMIKIAAKRGDCIALVDIPDKNESSQAIDTADEIKGWIETLVVDDVERENGESENAFKYAACFAPKISFKDGKEFPGSFAYLSCFAKHVQNFPEWFAMAGSVRGAIPFENVTTSLDFGDAANAVLQDRKTDGYKAVNTICNIRPYGNIVWGNRTLYPVTKDGESLGLVASNFLNIRNLCCSIKKTLYRASRRFTFEPNSDVLWTNFKNAIIPLLEEMKNGQGIRGYEIVKEPTSEKATLKARIVISPIEAVEDFDLTVELNDSVAVVE